VLPPTLAAGILFLCCLPSTVQSSIAFTSIARGNVAAAVVAASASNLFGIFITPVLVGLLMHTQGGAAGGWKSVQDIVVQLLLPFIAGQLARPLVAKWIEKHKQLIGYVDRGSILLVVYAAFSEAVVGGIWHKISPLQMVVLLRPAACCWPSCWPPPPSAREPWASRPRTSGPSPSAAPRRAWPPACRWRASCSPARRRGSSCCR
jgi:sodium/bile acid cotransporter 7